MQKSGLIPAHAGKTNRPALRGRSSAAHPRSRGENRRQRPAQPHRIGSSPLTRGKLLADTKGFKAGRLIPAHAGKTTCRLLRTRSRGAHPRSRGENLAAASHPVHALGSSPLTRGKLLSGERGLAPHRLIPAHAGKTTATCRYRLHPWAHPRSRGENARQARR